MARDDTLPNIINGIPPFLLHFKLICLFLTIDKVKSLGYQHQISIFAKKNVIKRKVEKAGKAGKSVA